jgi:peptidylprolyl isomerase
MEHLSRMRRTGPELGDSTRWTTITSVRVAADLPEAERIPLEMMNSNSRAFRDRLEEQRNSAAAWFVNRPRRIEVCSAAVPVRRIEPAGAERP